MSLQINFPKARKYYFWAIFMCYLVAADSNSSLADKNLFGTLAYRMISKAADTVPVDLVCMTPFSFAPRHAQPLHITPTLRFENSS